MSTILFILLYGGSYGLVLTIIASGLVITMGLMRIINLAHCSFSAVGGYVTAALMVHAGVPFLIAIVLAALSVFVFSLVVERIIFSYLYRAPELDQVLITIGLNFLVVGGLTVGFGQDLYPLPVPKFLMGSVNFDGIPFDLYRLFVVGACIVIVGSLWLIFDRTNLGLRIRAAVDNQSMAAVSGINVRRLFAGTFAVGCAIAAIGGAIGAPMLPLEPQYPFKYLILVLVVASVSGRGSVSSVAKAGITIGILDTAGRLLIPEMGAFFIYIILIISMIWPAKIFKLKRKSV